MNSGLSESTIHCGRKLGSRRIAGRFKRQRRQTQRFANAANHGRQVEVAIGNVYCNRSLRLQLTAKNFERFFREQMGWNGIAAESVEHQ